MRFCDLTREQKTEVKQRLLTDRMEKEGRSPSWKELSEAGETISDAECEEVFSGTEFVPDDFSCGVAADRDGVLDEIKEWVERTITSANYEASLGLKKSDRLEDKCIEWAREQILQHIDAVRE